MKSTSRISIVLSLVLPLSIAAAQTQATPNDRNDSEVSSSITTARCQYTPEDQACHAKSGGPADGEGHETSPLLPRRTGHPMRVRGPGRYPRSYPPTWGRPTRRRVIIGAIIGFGLGAAIGAKASTHQPAAVEAKATLGIGALGGLIGAAIGATAP